MNADNQATTSTANGAAAVLALDGALSADTVPHAVCDTGPNTSPGLSLANGPDTAVRLAPITAPDPAPDTGTRLFAGPPTGSLIPPPAQQPRTGARPGVVQLAIREKAALYAAYMPFLDGGGLFVPTTRSVHLGDELYLILSLMDDPNKLPVTGKVVWITPAGTPQRQQGLGVQFAKDDAGVQARARIEDLLGGTLKANRQTHTI